MTKRRTYIVAGHETTTVYFEVEASSEKEAIELVWSGEGEVVDMQSHGDMDSLRIIERKE